MLLKKVVAAAALAATASALSLVAVAGAAHASDGEDSTTSSSPTVSQSPSPAGDDDADDRDDDASERQEASATPTATMSPSDSGTATIRFRQQNVVVVSATVSDSATSTVEVKDAKTGTVVTWDVPQGVHISGHYKKLSDLRPGFTVHLDGTRTGAANPVADHLVIPGRNKKVALEDQTVVSVSGATLTVRDRKGKTSTWDVRHAKVQGKAHKRSALSRGDVVAISGHRVEGAKSGTASVVRVQKDVKPKHAKK